MLTEDYLMRGIRLAVAALLQANGLRKQGLSIQAIEAIEQAFEQLTGLRAELLDRLDDQSLLNTMLVQGELDRERTLLLVDLFKERGEDLLALHQAEPACFNFRRALHLTLETAFSSPADEFLALEPKIDELVVIVKTCQLPFEVHFSLFSFYEMCGSYAKAETVLRNLAVFEEHRYDMEQEYRDFCQRLLVLPDLALENGGLTREQVATLAKNRLP